MKLISTRRYSINSLTDYDKYSQPVEIISAILFTTILIATANFVVVELMIYFNILLVLETDLTHFEDCSLLL